MTAWLIWPPTSTTTASTGTNSGVQLGSVIGAMRTSPGPRSPGRAGSSTTRARPRATPGQPPMPVRIEPTGTGTTSESARRFHVATGGTSPSNTNGGTSPDSASRVRRRPATTSPNDDGSRR